MYLLNLLRITSGFFKCSNISANIVTSKYPAGYGIPSDVQYPQL